MVHYRRAQSLPEEARRLVASGSAVKKEEVRQSISRSGVPDQSQVSSCKVPNDRAVRVVGDVVDFVAAKATMKTISGDLLLHATRGDPTVPECA